jgi:diguanylate cyclase (GGDEF)-like protein/PAS domain S-box-containing protein
MSESSTRKDIINNLGTVMNASDSICFAKDTEGHYLYVNGAFCSQFSLDEGDALGKSDREIFPAYIAQLLDDNDMRIIANRTSETVEATAEIDGKPVSYRLSKAPLTDAQGNILGVCGVGINISKEKKLELERDSLLVELNKRTHALDNIATRDRLTGLPNRRVLEESLIMRLKDADRSHNKVALICMCLDGYVSINDTLGQKTGDKLLKTIAQRLKRFCRQNEVVARIGSDEFCLIIANLEESEELEKAVTRLEQQLSGAFVVDGDRLNYGISVGAAVYPADAETANGLILKADTAMREVIGSK